MGEEQEKKASPAAEIPASGGLPVSEELRRALNLLAYPVAVLPGYYAMDASIRRGIYKNFARHGVFDDLQAQRSKDYKVLIKKASVEKLPVMNDVRVLEENYRHAVKGRFEEMGFHTLTDYWKGLQRNQKIDALVLGATASGIVLGALLLMTEKSWAQEVRQLQDTEDQGKSV